MIEKLFSMILDKFNDLNSSSLELSELFNELDVESRKRAKEYIKESSEKLENIPWIVYWKTALSENSSKYPVHMQLLKVLKSINLQDDWIEIRKLAYLRIEWVRPTILPTLYKKVINEYVDEFMHEDCRPKKATLSR